MYVVAGVSSVSAKVLMSAPTVSRGLHPPSSTSRSSRNSASLSDSSVQASSTRWAPSATATRSETPAGGWGMAVPVKSTVSSAPSEVVTSRWVTAKA